MRFQSQLSALLTSALLVALAAFPAIADDGNGHGHGHGAPGPIAGAGLAYLVLAGGYYVVRRWRKQNTRK
jgi:hypothetical protein